MIETKDFRNIQIPEPMFIWLQQFGDPEKIIREKAEECVKAYQSLKKEQV